MPAADRPFRWAILGTGPVARRFALGLRCLDDPAEVGTVASRTPANAADFASALGGRVVETYAEAVQADIDAVYIATPPSLHEEHAMIAFEAGRPALIEKPLATDAEAARRIVAAATARGVFAMEAMWTRFLPLLRMARAQVGAGALGEPRAFEAAFLGATRPNSSVSLFDPARGGGALLNRGVYPLSLARFLMGPVTDVQSVARFGESGVDEECRLILRHASGALSTLSASLRTSGEPPMTLYGTEGTLRFDGPVWRPMGARLIAVRAGGGMAARPRFETLRDTPFAQAASRKVQALKRHLRRGRSLPAPLRGSGYHYEAAELMDCVRRGVLTSEIMPLSDSIEILDITDQARARWRGAS